MGKRKKRRSSISRSSLIATVAVVIIVAAVMAVLIFSFFLGPSVAAENVTIQSLTLLGGTASTHSISTKCQGDAILEVDLNNQSPNVVHLTNVVIFGSSLKSNATVLDSVSNSCLSISESNPAIDSSTSELFDLYSNTQLPFLTSYNYLIQLDDGQSFNGTLIAQS